MSKLALAWPLRERPKPHSQPRGRVDGKGRIVGRDVAMKFAAKSGPVVALDNLDIEIQPGEFLALLGPSGCGKSTLLNLIAGILKPTSGSVTIDDKPVQGPNPGCGIVFQHHSLFPWMSVMENVAFGPRQLGDADPIGTARTFLSLVGLKNMPRPGRRACRAACNSASASPGRWRPIRRCS